MVIVVTTWTQYVCICSEKQTRAGTKRRNLEAASRDAKAHQAVASIDRAAGIAVHRDDVNHGVDYTIYPRVPRSKAKPAAEAFIGENFMGEKYRLPTWR